MAPRARVFSPAVDARLAGERRVAPDPGCFAKQRAAGRGRVRRRRPRKPVLERAGCSLPDDPSTLAALAPECCTLVTPSCAMTRAELDGFEQQRHSTCAASIASTRRVAARLRTAAARER
jgi:hypothetical protein